MGIGFAVEMLDGMVDEQGRCGERGLSEKQFEVLARYLQASEPEPMGGWKGSMGGSVGFYRTEHTGTIGRYRVHLSCRHHFHMGCAVESIEPWIEQLPDPSASEWVGEVGERGDFGLTLIRKGGYMRDSFNGYGTEWASVYTLVDDDQNRFVWKTTCELRAECGERVRVRATVKAHEDYKGAKQTVLTRCKVM